MGDLLFDFFAQAQINQGAIHADAVKILDPLPFVEHLDYRIGPVVEQWQVADRLGQLPDAMVCALSICRFILLEQRHCPAVGKIRFGDQSIEQPQMRHIAEDVARRHTTRVVIQPIRFADLNELTSRFAIGFDADIQKETIQATLVISE